MKKGFLYSIIATGFALLLSSCTSTKAPLFETGSPRLRTNSANGSASSKSLIYGRDKHGMPTYSFRQKNRIVRTTAYTHGESDHLIYGRNNAVGSTLRYSSTLRSAAADWSAYPVGTKFKIKGLPYTYVIDDYGSALVGTNTIDIYKPNRETMNRWGTRRVQITILQWGNVNTSLDYLSKRLSYPHCKQMYQRLQDLKAGKRPI